MLRTSSALRLVASCDNQFQKRHLIINGDMIMSGTLSTYLKHGMGQKPNPITEYSFVT